MDNIQLVANGLAMGSVYALVALGFILVYNAVGVVNFAQGDMVMFAAFLGFTTFKILGLPLPWALLAALLLMGAFGVVFERVTYYPLRNKPQLTVIITTIGMGIVLRNLALILWGPNPLKLPDLFSGAPMRILGALISQQIVFIIVVTTILVCFQYLFFKKTFYGKLLQATAQDQDAAKLMGIKVGRTISFTFVYNALLAGVAGLLLAPIFMISSDMGFSTALKAFVASMVGGFGSIPGAIIGGLFIGVVEIFAAAYISSVYKDGFAFLVLILFLLIYPQGLFGERVHEKV